jgi:hypothetical protein
MAPDKMSLAKIRNLVKLMREYGVTSFTAEGLTVNFAPKTQLQAVQAPAKQGQQGAADKQREYERILYHSAHGG